MGDSALDTQVRIDTDLGDECLLNYCRIVACNLAKLKVALFIFCIYKLIQ